MLELVDKIVEWVYRDEGLFDPASFPLKNRIVKGEIILKNEEVVLSGVAIIEEVGKRIGLGINIGGRDGEVVKKGVIGTVEGDAYIVLISERTILNTLSFMSGIATRVRAVVEKVKAINPKVKVAGTRKVIPVIGELEKIAIMHGGGDTHRLNLFDTAIIKDNHRKIYGSLKEAIRIIRKNYTFANLIEVEVESLEEAMEAVEAGAEIIMIDNQSPEHVEKIAKIIKEKNPNIIVEVSGGITEENITEYAKIPYVDVISMGKLTNEIKFVDISLEVI